jgi:hypothetical protein
MFSIHNIEFLPKKTSEQLILWNLICMYSCSNWCNTLETKNCSPIYWEGREEWSGTLNSSTESSMWQFIIHTSSTAPKIKMFAKSLQMWSSKNYYQHLQTMDAAISTMWQAFNQSSTQMPFQDISLK